MVDPWGGSNEAYANLNNTLGNIRSQDLRDQSARQQLAMGAIQLQGAQRSETARQDAINAAANLQPTTRSMLYDQQGPVQPVDNSAGLSTRAALAQKIALMKNQTYDPSLTMGDNDLLPGSGVMTQGATDIQAQQIAPLQAQMDAIPATAQTAGEALPQVSIDQAIPVTDGDKMAAMIKSYMANGETAKAMELFKMAHEHAQAQGQINATGGGSLDDYYTKVAKASLSATQSDQIEKGLTTVAALAKEGPQSCQPAEPVLISEDGRTVNQDDSRL